MASDRYGCFLTVIMAAVLAAALARIRAPRARALASVCSFAVLCVLGRLTAVQLGRVVGRPRPARLRRAWPHQSRTPGRFHEPPADPRVPEGRRGAGVGGRRGQAQGEPAGQGYQKAAAIIADKKRISAYYGPVSYLSILQDQLALAVCEGRRVPGGERPLRGRASPGRALLPGGLRPLARPPAARPVRGGPAKLPPVGPVGPVGPSEGPAPRVPHAAGGRGHPPRAGPASRRPRAAPSRADSFGICPLGGRSPRWAGMHGPTPTREANAMIRSWFPTLIYSRAAHEVGRRAAQRRPGDECRSLRDYDKAGRDWSRRNYPGGYTSYASLNELHHFSSTFTRPRAHDRAPCAAIRGGPRHGPARPGDPHDGLLGEHHAADGGALHAPAPARVRQRHLLRRDAQGLPRPQVRGPAPRPLHGGAAAGSPARGARTVPTSPTPRARET